MSTAFFLHGKVELYKWNLLKMRIMCSQRILTLLKPAVNSQPQQDCPLPDPVPPVDFVFSSPVGPEALLYTRHLDLSVSYLINAVYLGFDMR